jgi:hypothetical protein
MHTKVPKILRIESAARVENYAAHMPKNDKCFDKIQKCDIIKI